MTNTSQDIACSLLSRATVAVKLCSKCREPRDRPGQRYCRRCNATANRECRARQRVRLDALMRAAAGMCESCTRRARREVVAVELVTAAIERERVS
jgi:hypothetical protein